jgi:hypothetical protein
MVKEALGERGKYHQWLRRQDLPITPPPNIHIRTLVPDRDELIVETPPLQQFQRVFPETQAVSEPQELAHLLENDHFEALVVHGHGAREAAQSGADNYDPLRAIGGWTERDRVRHGFSSLSPESSDFLC